MTVNDPASVSGLPWLRDGIRAFFDTWEVDAVVRLGWRELAKQVNQAPKSAGGPFGARRVVIIPSDRNGKGGSFGPPKNPGPRVDRTTHEYVGPRTLFIWYRLLTISIWAYDPTDREDEEKQIQATETLHEWVKRAVWSLQAGRHEWGDPEWVKPEEWQFGRELQIPLLWAHPIFDVTFPLVKPVAVGAVEKNLNPPTEEG